MAGKKALLDDWDSDSADGDAAAQPAGSTQLNINEDYARRFEHNKKREERQRLTEKYGEDESGDDEAGSDSDSSTNVTEDDEAFLATAELDAQISATIQAIRNKDPRVYDKSANFFTESEQQQQQDREEQDDGGGDGRRVKPQKKDKPMYLQDYHRERYMKGDVDADMDDGEEGAGHLQPLSYHQEQDALKRSLLSEISAAAAAGGDEADGDEALFKKKEKPQDAGQPDKDGVHPSRSSAIKITGLDIQNADKDPERFLSNFLASRAWIPEDGTGWNPFESDDEEDQADSADEWEHAYNMRFEDPEKSNEVLVTYSRSLTSSRSVRREEETGRRRRREQERERKEAERRQRHEEKARLKRLKVEETEERLAKFRQTAGSRGRDVKDEEWIKLIDEEWDNDRWEEAMKRKLDDEYYAQPDHRSDLDQDGAEERGGGGDGDSEEPQQGRKKRSKKPKKPRWDDDIDITDIVPDFDGEEEEPDGLSDNEQEEDEGEGEWEEEEEEDGDNDNPRPPKRHKLAKHRKKERIAAKRDAKKTRARLEEIVGVHMGLEHHDLLDPIKLAPSTSSRAPDGDSMAARPAAAAAPRFRYRETSPNSYGLTARDILLAPSDAVLNQFAGVKKFTATFRDDQKKQRDRKSLGKKARLRQWRKEVFGPEYQGSGPTYGFEGLVSQLEEGEGRDGAGVEQEGSSLSRSNREKKSRERKIEGWKDADEEKKKGKKRKRPRDQA